MGIGKTNTHPGEPLHVRGVQLLHIRIPGELLEGARVPHAHVIRHHYYDVRRHSKTGSEGKECQGYWECYGFTENHVLLGTVQ